MSVVSATVLLVSCCGAPGPGGLLGNLGDLEGLRLLRGVRVVRAGVDLELLQLLAAEGVLREHAADRLLDGALGEALEQLRVADGLEPARVPGVAVGDLVLALAPGQGDLRGVDDDDIVTTVDVRGEARLVLPTEQGGDLRRQSAEDDVGSVDDVPALLDVAGLRCVRAHGRSLRFSHRGRRGRRTAAHCLAKLAAGIRPAGPASGTE